MIRAPRDLRTLRLAAPALAWLVCLAPSNGEAQVVLDPSFSSATVGPGEYAPGLDTDYLIRESYGQRSGNNLFHRFSQFDVPAPLSATFVASSTGIERVIAHVASDHASQINGTLRSTIPGADLYFLNPRGVVFGEGARLDLQGAFHASSASYLRFADETRFGQDAGGPAVTITSADPAAWGFLSAPLGELHVAGAHLHTPDQADLSLVGGGITITGSGNAGDITLQAPSATMTLVSVGSDGEVVFGADATTPPDVSGFEALGPITLGGDAVLDASGVDDQVLIVRGDSLSVDGATILANHTGPGDHPGDAVDLDIEDQILFRSPSGDGNNFLQSVAYPPNGASGPDVGSGGRVIVSASEFMVEGDTEIVVGTTCAQSRSCLDGGEPGGHGGNLEFNTDRFVLQQNSLIYVTNAGRGDAGDLIVRAREIDLSGSATARPLLGSVNGTNSTQPTSAFSFPQGQGGGIVLEASERVLLRDGARVLAVTNSNGRGGDISIRTGDLEMTDSTPDPGAFAIAQISTETYGQGLAAPASGEGRAGDISINATGDISLETVEAEISSATLRGANGLTGSIHLAAPQGTIRVAERARVLSILESGSGAPLTLEAKSIEVLSGSEVRTGSRGAGTIGDVTLVADSIRISGTGPAPGQPSQVASNPDTDGNANANSGTISIDGRQLLLSDGAIIQVQGSGGGASGNVLIGDQAPLQSVWIDDATIKAGTTASGLDGDEGGMIQILADSIRMDNEAIITASNFVTGGVGAIRLIGEEFEISGGSSIQTNAGQEDTVGNSEVQGGNISIQMTKRFQANDAILSANAPSKVISSSGGNLDLEAGVLVLSRTTLKANSNANRGGEIRIVAGQLLIAANNPPPDTSGGSVALDGVVEILSAETNTTSAVPRPSIAYEDPTRRLATGCEARTAAQGSLYLLPRPINIPPGERLDAPDATLAPNTSACGPPS
jgi:filamentous hemagglutinin family protein